MPRAIAPRTLAKLLVEAAEAKKAWDPAIVDLRRRTTIADYFVICDGETDRQLQAIADEMMERARAHRVRPLRVDGYETDSGWILLDFDSVLAHVFLPGERSYYDLESLWKASAAKRAASQQATAGGENVTP
ncbi:MAG: ribosome silencing factor [Candidatus Dormibacteraeota bacterium]|nr:ribosome silencing factor [Candidatus Dormibacteraeota bacterium]